MVDPSDTLLTIAEIAIAVVGFAGIAFVLRAGSPRPINLFRLQLMVESSVLAVVFSFFPILLLSGGASAERVWTVSSGVLAVATPTYVASILIRQARRFGAALLPEALIADSTTVAATCVVTVLLLLNALGWAFEERFTGYLIGLFWALAGSVGLFVRIILLSGASRARPEDRLDRSDDAD